MTGNYGTDFRWENNASSYLALPNTVGRPILEAFSYLYQVDPDWAPYNNWTESKLQRVGVAIPYFDN